MKKMVREEDERDKNRMAQMTHENSRWLNEGKNT
jgi:hypothetical protein